MLICFYVLPTMTTTGVNYTYFKLWRPWQLVTLEMALRTETTLDMALTENPTVKTLTESTLNMALNTNYHRNGTKRKYPRHSTDRNYLEMVLPNYHRYGTYVRNDTKSTYPRHDTNTGYVRKDINSSYPRHDTHRLCMTLRVSTLDMALLVAYAVFVYCLITFQQCLSTRWKSHL